MKKVVLGCVLWSLLVLTIIGSVLLPIQADRVVSLHNIEPQKNSALVFFGFPTCSGSCPVTMAYLTDMIQTWPNDGTDSPDVIFINIDLDSNEQATQEYAQSFHSSFYGYQPTYKQLKQFTADFGLNIKKIQDDISHKARTYYIEKQGSQWRLKQVFNPERLEYAQLSNALSTDGI